jgi:hypothetical protein
MKRFILGLIAAMAAMGMMAVGASASEVPGGDTDASHWRAVQNVACGEETAPCTVHMHSDALYWNKGFPEHCVMDMAVTLNANGSATVENVLFSSEDGWAHSVYCEQWESNGSPWQARVCRNKTLGYWLQVQYEGWNAAPYAEFYIEDQLYGSLTGEGTGGSKAVITGMSVNSALAAESESGPETVTYAGLFKVDHPVTAEENSSTGCGWSELH